MRQVYIARVRTEQLEELRGALEFASLRGSKEDRGIAKLILGKLPRELKDDWGWYQLFLSPKEKRLTEDVVSALTTLDMPIVGPMK